MELSVQLLLEMLGHGELQTYLLSFCFFFDPLATGPGLGIDDVEDLEETLYGVLNVMESLSSVLFPG